MKRHAAVHLQVHIAGMHGGVHIFVNQAENEGFAADNCLVVAFHVADGLFVLPAVAEFMPEEIQAPILIRCVIDEFEPAIGYAHGKPVVKAAAAFVERRGQSRHAADIFGHRDGIGAHGVDHLVGKCQIGERIFIHSAIKVAVIGGKGASQAAVVIEHAGDAVKTEAIHAVFIKPEAAVGEQEMEHFGFVIIKTA